MSGGVRRRLKAAAAYLLILALLLAALAAAAGEASARASLLAYMTAGPNTWEMMGFNVTGTAAKFIVDHQGWNVSRTFGNVGIGDGSVRALNLTSNINDIDYTENNFMAGDVSMAPWDPGRIKDFSIAEENLPELNTSTANVSEARAGENMALNDPFHSILLGRPVGDLLYEHPHAITANMYSRLIGLRLPGGATVSIGMRAIGYGY